VFPFARARLPARYVQAPVSILAFIPEFTLGIYGEEESSTESAERSANLAFEADSRDRWRGYCDENP
jgi:hypothetical protein